MNYPSETPYLSNIRIEIAVALEDIDAESPGIVKFKIPVLQSGTDITTSYIDNRTLMNRTLAISKMSNVTMDDFIELRVPKEYTVYYGKPIIPKGTRFLVAFIGGNINDMRIIGRYDYIEED